MARWKNSRQAFNTLSSETTLTQNTLKVKKKKNQASCGVSVQQQDEELKAQGILTQ